MPDVSPALGHASLAKPSVKAAQALFITSSIPVLTSQFRGPFPINMAETDEERQKREEEERKRKEDEEKRTNFDKVREKAEREEAARKKAEEERDQLLQEKREREEAEKKAAEDKMKAQQAFEQLAQQKEAEAKAKADEAATEKARADAAEAKLKKIEEQQEAELNTLLESIPEEKRPPLDPSDSVEKRLATVRYAQSLLNTGPKPPVGAGVKSGSEDKKGRRAELLDAGKQRPLTEEETFELMGLGEE